MRPRRGSGIYRLSVNGSKSFFITAVKFRKAEAADKYPAGELRVKFYVRYLEKLLARRAPAPARNYDFYYCLNNFLSRVLLSPPLLSCRLHMPGCDGMGMKF